MLGASKILEEFASVLITIGKADHASIDADVTSDLEVFRHEGVSRVGFVEADMSSEEGSLRNSTVLLLGLNEHDGFVLQVVINGQFSDSVVLKSALNNVFFAETVESKNNFVEL